MGEIYIKANNKGYFRNGHWARLMGVVSINSRLCYRVEFIDGKTDEWPVMESESFMFSMGDIVPPHYDWKGERVYP